MLLTGNTLVIARQVDSDRELGGTRVDEKGAAMISRPKEGMIAELLDDPLVQMMMHADRVDPQDLARELHKLARSLDPKSLPIVCGACPA